jgi:hypothetical protein
MEKLDYGRSAPILRRQSTLKLATLFSGLVTLVVVIMWLPASIRYVQREYWGHQCLNYIPNDGEVCHESHLTSEEELWVDQARVPDCWTKFYSSVSPYGFRSNGTVFLHERRSRSGHERLVAIDVVVSDPHAMSRGFYFRAKIFDCSSITQGARQMKDMDLATGSSVESYTPYHDLRVYSVKADSMDHSHFTICLELDGKTKYEEGWLDDDDTIELVLRD